MSWSIYPKTDTSQGTVRTFVAVLDDGSNWDRNKPLTWMLRKKSETEWHKLSGDGHVLMGPNHSVIQLDTTKLDSDNYVIGATQSAAPSDRDSLATFSTAVLPRASYVDAMVGAVENEQPVPFTEVSLTRTKVPATKDEILWSAIRASTSQLSYPVYERLLDRIFASWQTQRTNQSVRRLTNGPDADAQRIIANHGPYKVLQHATEAFVMANCAVVPKTVQELDAQEEAARYGHQLPDSFDKMWEEYNVLPAGSGDGLRILPYLEIIRRKLGDSSSTPNAPVVDSQISLLHDKLISPCMVELIWSYWHEEGMLVQTFNAITQRFQNVRSVGDKDPLAQLEIDPLRALNPLLWGYVQDERKRLSVLRRAHEYAHQYGFTIHGKATAAMRIADRRSKFLESFHNLLHLCVQFYVRDDDTTVIADGFPILNAIKETHYLLSHGAHNQFGDLPATARQEMLMQQYILSRPEMREFLGGRVMVPYAEPWMDRVDVVKNLKGWTDASVVHFHDLAVFGEQILLSVRYGAWSLVNDPNQAANWARYFRPEIQGYVHAYRAVTSVDLTAELSDQRSVSERFLPPSVHLRNRLLAHATAK